MCYLPKATFYVYFGFFFFGYLWIFGLLFYKTITSNTKSQIKTPELYPNVNDEVAAGSNRKQFFAKDNVLLKIYDHRSAALASDDSPACIIIRHEPSFLVCIHDPEKDRGISAHINLYKEWESDLTTKLSDALKQFHTVDTMLLDIGANLGYYSLLAARLGYRAIAVEPFADNLKLLGAAARKNNISHLLTILQNAISDKRENLTFVEMKHNFGGRFALRNDEAEFNFRTFTKLQASAILLDDLLTLIPDGVNNVVLKLDIQGDECFALRKPSKLLETKNVPSIFMEWEELAKSDNKDCVDDMIKQLYAQNYKPFNLDGQLIRKLDRQDLNIPQNIVWKRKPA